MGFWQDNNFYNKTNHSVGNTPKKPSRWPDFGKLELLKPYPEGKEDIFDAFNAKENNNHIMDALRHCVDNKIPFLLWNGFLYNWHQERLDYKNEFLN